jgi:23S rRNA (adenine1618-N6)-methyltransferase|tara:strand:- start:1258 stop:2130 length:873 start_codon:yes stop_codon:yes gene_type:complete
LHNNNPFKTGYNFKELVKYNSRLVEYVNLNEFNKETIDFNSNEAIYELNRSLLLANFSLSKYYLPKGYLIPGVPGRLNYLLHLKGFIHKKFNYSNEQQLRGLDVGSGANAIYCILGAQHFNWIMVGSEFDLTAIEVSKKNILSTKNLDKKINIRRQLNKSFLLKNIITENDYFDFTVCNPPFHSSKEEAAKNALLKANNLKKSENKKAITPNFSGQANELWCNGGEQLFIKRLIKESILFKEQVKVFSSLVSKSNSLIIIKQQLKKVNARFYILPMNQGNKKSRLIFWWF